MKTELWKNFSTVNIVLNISVSFLKVLLNRKICFKSFSLKTFPTLPRNFPAGKSSKQRFNHGESDVHIKKTYNQGTQNLALFEKSFSLQMFSHEVCLALNPHFLTASEHILL